MIEDTGIETHGTGNEPVMDEALVIGNIGIDPETDSVDTIAVVDPDEVDFMDPVFQRLQAGAAEIISRAARDKGQEVICACDFVEEMMDRPVAADCGEDSPGIMIFSNGEDSLFCGSTDLYDIVAMEFL